MKKRRFYPIITSCTRVLNEGVLFINTFVKNIAMIINFNALSSQIIYK